MPNMTEEELIAYEQYMSDCYSQAATEPLDPTLDGAAYNLMRVVNRVLRNCKPGTTMQKHDYDSLMEAAADVEGFFDGEESPRDMGWVDDRGRP